jgi:hypothetical protein
MYINDSHRNLHVSNIYELSLLKKSITYTSLHYECYTAPQISPFIGIQTVSKIKRLSFGQSELQIQLHSKMLQCTLYKKGTIIKIIINIHHPNAA